MAIRKFKPGEKVLVTKKACNYEEGWDNTWVDGMMDESVGKILSVTRDEGARGVELDDGYGFDYPRHILKRVGKKGVKKNVDKR